MTTVGIIANPAAGKDIRRLVAHGRFVPNQEKVNIIKRIFAGLEAAGVERVVVMPDFAMLGRGALDGAKLGIEVEFLEMPVFNEERDTTRPAAMMAEMDVGCLITLGGDGTNRAVAKGSQQVPLVPVSTGTNNVFPVMVEGTLAGLAAGVVARGIAELEKVSTVSKRLEVYVDGELRDVALVDVAISREQFVGARAIWNMETVHELFLARAEPASIGLSAIGAQLQPISMKDDGGLQITPGAGNEVVLAPVAPGMVTSVPIKRWRRVDIGDSVEITLRPCTIALDGERTFSVLSKNRAEVRLTRNGPPVVSIEAALRQAAERGAFVKATISEN